MFLGAFMVVFQLSVPGRTLRPPPLALLEYSNDGLSFRRVVPNDSVQTVDNREIAPKNELHDHTRHDEKARNCYR